MAADETAEGTGEEDFGVMCVNQMKLYTEDKRNRSSPVTRYREKRRDKRLQHEAEVAENARQIVRWMMEENIEVKNFRWPCSMAGWVGLGGLLVA